MGRRTINLSSLVLRKSVSHFLLKKKKWLIYASLASFVGLLSMGLPGFLIMVACDGITWTANLLLPASLKIRSLTDFYGEESWPVAIWISLFWPWFSLISTYLIKTRIPQMSDSFVILSEAKDLPKKVSTRSFASLKMTWMNLF